MAASRSPRRQDPQREPEDPPANRSPLSSVIPPPEDYSEDRALTMIDAISNLLGSPGWQWLIDYANTEYGSKAVRARLHVALSNNGDPAILGAITQATLASSLAVERLLNAPAEMLTRLRMQQRQHQQQRKQSLGQVAP